MPEPKSRGAKFVSDLGFYAVGNIGSKLIAFLLLPFYTYFIHNPADYGYYDICVAIVMGLVPIISLQLGDGGFRYLTGQKDECKKRAIVSFIIRTLLRNVAVFAFAAIILSWLVEIRYMWFIAAFALTQTAFDVTLQIVRGLGYIRTFVTIGIVNTFITAAAGILFVALLDMGVPGIFISVILARIVSVGFCLFHVPVFTRIFETARTPPELRRTLLSYSLPMVPSAICYWLLSWSLIFFINHYLGLTDNGLYAVSAKFSSILTVLTYIFYQTWQQNAIEQYDSPGRDAFLSRIFRIYFYFLTAVTIITPFALRLNYFWIVAPEYRMSARFLYLNILMVMMSSLASFFEIGYQCAGRTGRIVPSFVVTAAAMIGGYMLIVPRFGIDGALGYGCILYFLLVIYRAIDTRRFLPLSAGPDILFLSIAIIAFGIVYYMIDSSLSDIISIISCLIWIAVCGGKFLRSTIAAFKN